MFNLSENYEKMWRAIIRPPRKIYTQQQLGPKKFKKNGLAIQRTDIELTNKKGLKLKCSHFQPLKRIRKDLPCVIYLHGNSSCRLQALSSLSSLLCHEITLFTLDTSGSGISQGEYISLGYYERDDVDVVFNHLRASGTVSSIGIWGRSMGAVTALMYADSNHEIACLVLDSPFSNLTVLCEQLAAKYAPGMLQAFSSIALHFISKTIKQKNNFDIEDINPLKHVQKAYIPALFIAGKEDDFIPMKHSELLHAAYGGDKQLLKVDGDHNDQRDPEVFDKISTFFYFGLHVKDLVVPDNAFIQKEKKQVQVPQIINPFQEDYDLDPEEEVRIAIQQSLKISNKNLKE